MISLYIIDNTDLPNWSEALQTFVGIVGVPLTIYTLWKLVKKDKEREAEIASLANIAEQLKEMMIHNRNVFMDSKKPHMEFAYEYERYDIVKIFVKNINPHAVLTNFIVVDNIIVDDSESSVTTDRATQEFTFNITVDKLGYNGSKDVLFTYFIDDVFRFSQTVKLSLEGKAINFNASIINIL
jgi:hypothetical protein